MAHALIRSLVVRPFFSMDLCFPQPGIIRSRSDAAKLGKQAVDGFDLNSLILDHLHKKRGQGIAEKFIYTSSQLLQFLAPKSLFILRNDRQAADLDSAIQRRNIVFLEKYGHIASLADATSDDSWPTRHTSKWNHLVELKKRAIQRHQELVAMIEADGETQPRASESDTFYYDKLVSAGAFASPAPSRVETITRTNSKPVGMFHSETVMEVTNDQRSQSTGGAASKGEALHKNVTKPTYTFPTLVPGGFDFPIHVPLFDLFESQVNTTDHFTQRTRRLDGDYRHPYQEEFIRFHREIVLLEQELVDVFTFNKRLPHLAEIWEAELGSIHEEVRRAQIAYVETFLIPPPTELGVITIQVPEDMADPATTIQRNVDAGLSGVITAVNKDVGEFVQAGEPIIRIENVNKALLMGLLIFRGRLAVAQGVRLDFRGLFEEPNTTALPPSPSPPPAGTGRLDGKIVTIRGHDSDNDIWDVVIECLNWDASLLPINYTFESTPDRYGEVGAELQGAVVEIL